MNMVSKTALLSDAAMKAFRLADYRMRTNARYSGWDDEKRWAYCMDKAFKAAFTVMKDVTNG